MSDHATEPLTIDCERCDVRPQACSDCVVSVLLGAPPTVEWDADERRAVDALADAGMLPRLRLVRRNTSAGGVSHRQAG
ncbi:MAG: hypothetical protein ACRDQ7_00250 [Haloechinothrix sp.]